MPLLELDGVGKQFGGLPAVDGVTIGAGKSTLLKLIVGLERPTRGTIRLADADITRLTTHRVRRRGVAMVQQTPRAFPTLTVLENAAIGAMFGSSAGRHAEEDALRTGEEMLALVGLADRRDDHVGNLNLHEQRFLELARALSGSPRLLLLDEVMAGLTESELISSIQMVRTIRRELGVTVVWVEHVMAAVIELAERVVVLDFGRVLAEGPADVVMRNEAVIEAYLGAGAGDARG